MATTKKATQKKTKSDVGSGNAAVQVLREKLENVFDISSDSDIDTLVTNALNTYAQIAKFSKDGMSIFIGKAGEAEMFNLKFPFEEIEDLNEPSIKLKA